MRTVTARVAINCDVEINVEDDFNPDYCDLDTLFFDAFNNTPIPCDRFSKKPVDECDYRILSIWDDKSHKYIFET